MRATSFIISQLVVRGARATSFICEGWGGGHENWLTLITSSWFHNAKIALNRYAEKPQIKMSSFKNQKHGMLLKYRCEPDMPLYQWSVT